MKSSYAQNNYDEVFYNIVTAYKPNLCVELGVLHGYSTVAIAHGLDFNKQGHLDAYDLFEGYAYNHGNKEEVRRELLERGIEERVTLIQGDAFQTHHQYADNSVYLLHVDLSNTGEIVRKIMEAWDKKMVVGGLILFEGGTEERDNVEWVKKYNKEPMKPELERNPIIEANYVFGTYLKFPGLTVLLKKR